MENEISSLEELQSIIAEKPAVLAYFYNDNCAPCLSLRPKIIEMVDDHFPKMELHFVNSDKREIPANYAVYDNPTLLIFFDRKEYIRVSKYVSTAQLSEQVQRYYNMVFDEN
jgi:thiol-disulfide isomerase/thioredoxin